MINIPSMQELLSAGVHFGHRVSRSNARMKPYIYGAREGVHIIDLAKSEEFLKKAADALYELGKLGKVLLIVGTKKQAKEIVKSLAQEAGTPYLTERWFGGMLTNFSEIRKNINKLNDLKNQKAKGELSKYTKREQLLLARKLDKFEREAGGVANLDKLPDALFVVDAVAESTAVRETKRSGVLLFGLCDTNADPGWFDYPIPANDDGIKSIKIVCEAAIGAYSQGKKDAQVEEEKTEPKAGEVNPAADTTIPEAEVIEEEIEKKVLEESERKV